MKNSTATSDSIDKPIASISLDLDNLWSYMKTHGDSGWESFPSYLDTFIPLVLDVLDQFNLKITFFIVGQDAALDKNHGAIKMIAERGHEVGNHSFHHEVWLNEYPKEKIIEEILEAEKYIKCITGQRTTGFRGPGFVYSPTLLEVLEENEYLYDATILPTYIGPLARMYYFWKSNLNKEDRKQRKKIYSSFSESMRPVRAYHWQIAAGKKLLEIPVTTIPVFKTPFHLSYLLYLSRFSKMLMYSYLSIAVTLCRMTKTAPSFLLHPLDFLSREVVPELDFFPGMDLKKERKLKVFDKVIKLLSRHFHLVNMNSHAKHVIRENKIKTVPLNQ